ncbi:MAG: hypothetical protein ILA17_11335, partial [Ruminococcus sp.]|nr:hypothetical protein [Ruminococcus sp.]
MDRTHNTDKTQRGYQSGILFVMFESNYLGLYAYFYKSEFSLALCSSVCPKGLLDGRKFAESPQKTRAIQSAFLQADCGKIVSVFSVGARPLLQGVPSFKQSTGLFEIHP